MTAFERFVRIAERLGKLEAGSLVADQVIHDALGRAGPPPAYTFEPDAAGLLLPDGFEWWQGTYAGGLVYASCRRMGMDGERPYPHYGQWGKTSALAMCGAVMRARAGLVKVT